MDADIDTMHITTNPEFQPYLVQALATFQVDKVSKDKGKQCMKFDGVHILPCKKPENHATTISEELFLPEIQKSTKEVAPTSSSTSVPPPPPQRSIQASPIAGSLGLGSIKNKSASTSAPALPHAPPTNLQALIPTNQYKYSFLLEDKTAPQCILDCILNTSIPVPIKDLFAVLLDICKHFCNLTTVKQVITTMPATMVTVHINELASLNPLKVKHNFSNRVLHNDEGTIVVHHSLPLCVIEVKLGPSGCLVLSILVLGSEIIVMPKHIWKDIRLSIQSNHTMCMSSTNTNIDTTIGVLKNLALDFSTGEVMV